MTRSFSTTNTNFDKIISSEQFDQILEAILEGKYSWACALMLSSTGYNPLQYIPYRTYNRLIKQNRQSRERQEQRLEHSSRKKHSSSRSSSCSVRVRDLDYAETIRNRETKVGGGDRQVSEGETSLHPTEMKKSQALSYLNYPSLHYLLNPELGVFWDL